MYQRLEARFLNVSSNRSALAPFAKTRLIEVWTVIGKLACCCHMLIWTAGRLGMVVVYDDNLSKAAVPNLESRYLLCIRCPLGQRYEDLVPRFGYDREWNSVIRCIEWFASEAYG
jgi:hypothetical protein